MVKTLLDGCCAEVDSCVEFVPLEANCINAVCTEVAGGGEFDSVQECIALGTCEPPPLDRADCQNSKCVQAGADGEFGSIQECKDSNCEDAPLPLPEMPETGCVKRHAMPNVVTYWGNSGARAVEYDASKVTHASEIPDIFNVICLSFLLYDDRKKIWEPDTKCDVATQPGTKQWVVAGTQGVTFPDDDPGLLGLAEWLEGADLWGRERQVLMSLGGAQGFTYCEPVTSGMEDWPPGENRSKMLASDPEIIKLYHKFSCTGWDWDLEGKGDRGRINDMVIEGSFIWEEYLLELHATYPDMKMFTAAPEIAPASLEMYAAWFNMGAGYPNRFDELELPWEVLIGTQYYNNPVASVKWDILGGHGELGIARGLGLDWDNQYNGNDPQPEHVRFTSELFWDDVIISTDVGRGGKRFHQGLRYRRDDSDASGEFLPEQSILCKHAW